MVEILNSLQRHQRPILLILVVISLCFILFTINLFNRTWLVKPVLKSTSTITRIIHQSWKVTQLPQRFRMWHNTWDTCYPTWEHKLWTDEDNEKFIAKHYPWFLEKYRRFPQHIQRVDVVRYFYMFHYGGIYADLDTECLRSFEELLNGHELVFGAMEGQYGSANVSEGYTQNSFMYSKPRNLFWLDLIYRISNSSITHETGIEEATGPIVLSHAINEYRTRFPSAIKIYPPLYFNPFSWLKAPIAECKTLNYMSPSELRKCRDYFQNTSYVVQYHTQTWRHGKAL